MMFVNMFLSMILTLGCIIYIVLAVLTFFGVMDPEAKDVAFAAFLALAGVMAQGAVDRLDDIKEEN